MIKTNTYRVDFEEIGDGPLVLLLHATATGSAQWKHLIHNYKECFRFINVNLIGYGKTPKWSNSESQTLLDQVNILNEIPMLQDNKFSILGHSFGGSVAIKAADYFGTMVEKLVLLEPNPFFLLRQAGLSEAYSEVLTLKEKITRSPKNQWLDAVKFFADYWNGTGSWESYNNIQRAKFSENLKPNIHEWDPVLNELTTIENLERSLPKHTMFISAEDTVLAIRELKSLFQQKCKHWSFASVKTGGHMAFLKNPQQIIPHILRGLR